MHRLIIISTLTLWSLGKGHGGPAFTETVKGYVKDGWEVFLVTDEISNLQQDILKSDHVILVNQSIFKKGIQYRKIGLFFNIFNHISVTRSYIHAVERLLLQNKEDTVCYAYEIEAVDAATHISKKYGIPYVTRFQGTILSQYKNNLANRVRYYLHYRALSKRADLVIMTDDGTQGNKVLDSLGNMSRRLFVRNGLDIMKTGYLKQISLEEYTLFRKELNICADECMFLTVSRLVEWKRVDRALLGFSEFCKKNGEGKLVIVGDGNEKAKLKAYANELGIGDKVIFTGSIAHENVYKYMQCCDVFLSLYDLSNVGNPLLEAMAIGKCIITLDVGDTNKIVTNGLNGILLSYESLMSLGDVMKEMAENREKREQYGKEALLFAKQNFITWLERMEREINEVAQILS